MFDAKVAGGHALEIPARPDLTNGRGQGFMIASGANGFMNTSQADCSGAPFNFQPEYSSAKPQNDVPWGPGPYGINTEFEIGHFEPCTRVTGRSTLHRTAPFTDTFFNRCLRPVRGRIRPPTRGATSTPNNWPVLSAAATRTGGWPTPTR